MRYFPGIPIWESFFLSKGLFGEWQLYFALSLIVIACAQVLVSAVDAYWKKFLCLLLFVACLTWFSTGLMNIYVDTVMGLLLALALMAITESISAKDLFVPVFIAAFLAITKETGLALSLVCFFFIVLKFLNFRGQRTQMFLICGSGLLLIVLNYLFWKHYLLNRPDIPSFPIEIVKERIHLDVNGLSAHSREVLNHLGFGFISRAFPYPYSLIRFAMNMGFISLAMSLFFGVRFFKKRIQKDLKSVVCFLILTMFFALAFLFLKGDSQAHPEWVGSALFWIIILFIFFITRGFKLTATFLIALIGYTFILAVTYLYYLGTYEGLNLASFERYYGVFFLGFSVLGLYEMIRNAQTQNRVVLCSLVYLTLIFLPSPGHLVPRFYKDSDTVEMWSKLLPVKNKIINATPENCRIWAVFQDTAGFEMMILRFEIAPRQTNGGSWSLGQKYRPADVWTTAMTAAEFSTEARKYNYVALGRIDDRFIKEYGSFFNPQPQNNSVYKVTEIDGQISLVEL